MKGVCPFHREKTPSFTVSPAKQIFHCFGCHEGGDVIKFVQKIEHLEWIDAVKFLAEKYRIPLPEFRPSANNKAEQTEREKLLAVNQLALDHFKAVLKKAFAEDSEAARYLRSRGVEADLAAKFNVGLAPDAWSEFLDTARKSGYEREFLIESGLVIHNPQSKRHYDRFRNRIIFPISDGRGHPIAFGGRVYARNATADEPKYVNSPETSLYKKGQHLYALHLAKERITAEKRALLMEGYLDVMRAHQHGFENAVATCGTALTEEQARTLRKFCMEICFIYDGDEAGQKAMLRGCEILLEQDFAVRIISLPGNHDPDTFLVEHGAKAFAEAIAAAKDFFLFFRDSAAARFDRYNVQGKVQIAEMMLPLLRRVKNAIARETYARQLAEFLQVDPAIIIRQLNPRMATDAKRLNEQLAATDAATSRIEKMLIKAAIECHGARETIMNCVEPEWFQNDFARKWFSHCRGLLGDESLCWEMLLGYCREDSDAGFLRELALDESEPLPESGELLKHAISRLKFNHQRRKTAMLAQQIEDFYRETREHDEALMLEMQAHSPVHSCDSPYFLTRQPRKDTDRSP
jgi:DNA primase